MLSHFIHVRLFVTLLTVTCEASLSMGLSGREHWSGLPFPSPGDLSNPGIKPSSLMSPALAGGYFMFFYLSLDGCMELIKLKF